MPWKGIISIFVVGALVLVLVAGAHNLFLKNHMATVKARAVFDPLNATYIIDGQPVLLVNGSAAISAAPGSAAQIATSVFGEPVEGDLNGDGNPDSVLILVQSPGGSGTFYYAAVAINSAGGAEGTNAILLGDRVAPENIEIQNDQVIANYADRKPGEPMTARPSVGISKYMVLQGSTLVVVQ